MEMRCQGLASDLDHERSSIQVLEVQGKSEIDQASQAAYYALEAVVRLLVTLERGDTRLSREDVHILAAVDESVAKFEYLSTIARKLASDLSIHAGECMARGDEASEMMKEILKYVRPLSNETNAVLEARNHHLREAEGYCDREEQLKKRFVEAVNEQAVSKPYQPLSEIV